MNTNVYGNAQPNAAVGLVPVPGYIPEFRDDLCSIF